MKKFAIATAFALTSTSVFAGGLDDPIVEAPVVPEVIVAEDTSSSSQGILVPIMFLILIAGAAAS